MRLIFYLSIILFLAAQGAEAQGRRLLLGFSRASTTSEFTPLDESSLALWLDTAGLPSVGTGITTWLDASGFGRDGTNISVNKMISTNGPNSTLMAHCGGNTFVHFGVSGGRSVFRNCSNAVVFLLARSYNTNLNVHIWDWSINGGTSPRARNQMVSNQQAGGRRLDGDTTAGIGPVANLWMTNFVIWETHFKWGSSDLEFYTNGVLAASTTSFQTDGATSDTDSDVADLGSFNGGFNFTGLLGDFIIITNSISANRAIEFRTWYTNRFGL